MAGIARKRPGQEWEERIGQYGMIMLRLRTAEMLAFPAMVCGLRACRRARWCQRVLVDDQMPVCCGMLTDEQRQAYDTFLVAAAQVYEAAHRGEYGILYRLVIDRLKDDFRAVTDIVRNALPPGDNGHAHLDAALRARARIDAAAALKRPAGRTGA